MELLQPLWGFLGAHPYAATFAATVIDATGLPFPGRVLLVVAGAWAAQSGSDLLGVTLAGALGALVGDNAWYLIGRLGGKRALGLYCRLSPVSRRCVRTTTNYYRKYGALTIIIGRFVAGVRILTSPLAGSGVISYPRFLAFDVVGALLWAGLFVGLGWVLGVQGAAAVESLGWVSALLLVVALGALAGVVGYRLRRRARHGPAVD